MTAGLKSNLWQQSQLAQRFSSTKQCFLHRQPRLMTRFTINFIRLSNPKSKSEILVDFSLSVQTVIYLR